MNKQIDLGTYISFRNYWKLHKDSIMTRSGHVNQNNRCHVTHYDLLDKKISQKQNYFILKIIEVLYFFSFKQHFLCMIKVFSPQTKYFYYP